MRRRGDSKQLMGLRRPFVARNSYRCCFNIQFLPRRKRSVSIVMDRWVMQLGKQTLCLPEYHLMIINTLCGQNEDFHKAVYIVTSGL
jgi:hypothetical protein